jgi:hypothetical protein
MAGLKKELNTFSLDLKFSSVFVDVKVKAEGE